MVRYLKNWRPRNWPNISVEEVIKISSMYFWYFFSLLWKRACMALHLKQFEFPSVGWKSSCGYREEELKKLLTYFTISQLHVSSLEKGVVLLLNKLCAKINNSKKSPVFLMQRNWLKSFIFIIQTFCLVLKQKMRISYIPLLYGRCCTSCHIGITLWVCGNYR